MNDDNNFFGPLAGQKHADDCALQESPQNACDCGVIQPEPGD